MDAHSSDPLYAEVLEAAAFPQRLVFNALHADYSEDIPTSTELPEDRAGTLVCQRLLKGGKGHWGPLEHPSLSILVRADHNTMMQLRTHRIGCTFDFQSMRYTGERISKVARRELDPSDVFYVRPPGTYWDRQGDCLLYTSDAADEP